MSWWPRCLRRPAWAKLSAIGSGVPRGREGSRGKCEGNRRNRCLALRAAVEAIEKVSSVEVVIAMRARARRWLVPHAVAGVTLAAIALAFTLWSDTDFELWTILVLPLAAGLIGGFIVEEIGAIHRLFPRRDLAREVARATFYERTVHATTRRTGLLVYLAFRERHVELVGDVAVLTVIDQDQLDAWARAIEPAIPLGAAAIGKAIAELAGELGKRLPRHAGVINELHEEVVVMTPHPHGKKVVHS